MSNELKRLNQTAKDQLSKNIVTMMGGNLVDIELDTDTLNLAIEMAVAKYRQRAENSVEESYMFMELKENTNDYILPNEVVEVRSIFRRGFGMASSNSDITQIDPFEVAYISNYLLMGSDTQSLSNYELYMSNIELAGKMFGYYFDFIWNSQTKRLKIARRITTDREEIMIHCYNYIPLHLLLQDTYAGIWLTKYALAEAKTILGSAYGKYTNLPGPQGGVSLRGDSLISEGIQEKADLEAQLKTYTDGSQPLGIIFG